MSCVLTASPRPLTISPCSVRAVCLLMLLESEWRSSTVFARTTPLAFCHGPFPMRSRALTPATPPGSVVLRDFCSHTTLLSPILLHPCWELQRWASSRTACSRLRLVLRRPRHARSEGGQGIARRVGGGRLGQVFSCLSTKVATVGLCCCRASVLRGDR
jgi:hypothetical protein